MRITSIVYLTILGFLGSQCVSQLPIQNPDDESPEVPTSSRSSKPENPEKGDTALVIQKIEASLSNQLFFRWISAGASLKEFRNQLKISKSNREEDSSEPSKASRQQDISNQRYKDYDNPLGRGTLLSNDPSTIYGSGPRLLVIRLLPNQPFEIIKHSSIQFGQEAEDMPIKGDDFFTQLSKIKPSFSVPLLFSSIQSGGWSQHLHLLVDNDSSIDWDNSFDLDVRDAKQFSTQFTHNNTQNNGNTAQDFLAIKSLNLHMPLLQEYLINSEQFFDADDNLTDFAIVQAIYSELVFNREQLQTVWAKFISEKSDENSETPLCKTALESTKHLELDGSLEYFLPCKIELKNRLEKGLDLDSFLTTRTDQTTELAEVALMFKKLGYLAESDSFSTNAELTQSIISKWKKRDHASENTKLLLKDFRKIKNYLESSYMSRLLDQNQLKNQ